MNLSLVIWVVVAVCLAWTVGAYSRLNRMREQAVRARASLLKYSKHYQVLAAQWQSRLGIAGDGSGISQDAFAGVGNTALKNLFLAVQALQAPLAAWDEHPTRLQSDGALGKALDAVQVCVDALVSAPEDLAGSQWPTEERGRWVDLLADIRVRRSRYNAYASELNEAASQMPAALIARLTGMRVLELV